MRVPNEPADDPGGPLSELLRLQAQFQARLAEETMSYLRRLQGAAAPAAPGTVLVPDPDTTIETEGPAGGSVTLRVELENRQRVHCMVRPLLGELVSATGVAWQPDATAHPPSRLIAPGELSELAIAVRLPSTLPTGTYRGSLLLLGFRKGAVPVAISVAQQPERGKTRARSTTSAKPRSKPRKGTGKPTSRKSNARSPRNRATGARDDPEGAR